MNENLQNDEIDFDCISDESIIELVKERNLNTSELDDFSDEEITTECNNRGIVLAIYSTLSDYDDLEIQEEFESRGLNEIKLEIKTQCEDILFAINTNRDTRSLFINLVQMVTGKIVCK